jgi:phospholipid/cholesterol/gamma-HCH transport system substrate-binding protein
MTRRLRGLAFVVFLAGLLVLSILAYRKTFTPVTWVTLHTDHTGMQLGNNADVKVRGVVVGEVREITADGAGASLRLALDPALTARIPANVNARLVPKTLFGEKYVDLVPPSPATAAPVPALRSGAVISQDRSQTALELERILDRTLPLLQAIQPDKLATVLGALSYALEGRGERTGGDLVALDTILKQLNAEMPTIAEDVRRLTQVLDTYNGAASDLLAILRDATVTANTVTDQRAQLAGLLADTTDLADTTRIFLDRHDDRLIQLGQVSRPVLELLAAYSPEYPCLLQGVVALQPQADGVFASGRMHITLEVTKDNGKYVAGRDDPVYGARNGPNCRGLPSPGVPAPEVPINDGYDHRSGGSAAVQAAMGYAGTAEESGVIKPLVAAATGTPASEVPDVAVLLWGPLLRGAVVNAK